MYALFSAVLAAAVSANPLAERQVSGTSTVNLGNNTGSITHRASGFIYGIPDTPDQIPDSFYIDMGFNYARAGGAQVPAPGRGWIWGLTEYKVRSSLNPVSRLIFLCLIFNICTESICLSSLELQDRTEIRRSVHLPHSRSLGRRRNSELKCPVSRR